MKVSWGLGLTWRFFVVNLKTSPRQIDRKANHKSAKDTRQKAKAVKGQK